MPRGAEKHSAHCERIRVRAERLREPFQLPPVIVATYSRPNSSTEIDASVHFSRRSSRHLCRHRVMHTWLEPRRSATVRRALTCVPDVRPRSAHLSETCPML